MRPSAFTVLVWAHSTPLTEATPTKHLLLQRHGQRNYEELWLCDAHSTIFRAVRLAADEGRHILHSSNA